MAFIMKQSSPDHSHRDETDDNAAIGKRPSEVRPMLHALQLLHAHRPSNSEQTCMMRRGAARQFFDTSLSYRVTLFSCFQKTRLFRKLNKFHFERFKIGFRCAPLCDHNQKSSVGKSAPNRSRNFTKAAANQIANVAFSHFLTDDNRKLRSSA